MEQLRFSRGLIIPLVQTVLWSHIITYGSALPVASLSLEQVPSTFVSRRLLTSDCVSPNVMLLIQ